MSINVEPSCCGPDNHNSSLSCCHSESTLRPIENAFWDPMLLKNLESACQCLPNKQIDTRLLSLRRLGRSGRIHVFIIT